MATHRRVCSSKIGKMRNRLPFSVLVLHEVPAPHLPRSLRSGLLGRRGAKPSLPTLPLARFQALFPPDPGGHTLQLQTDLAPSSANPQSASSPIHRMSVTQLHTSLPMRRLSTLVRGPPGYRLERTKPKRHAVALLADRPSTVYSGDLRAFEL